MLHRRQTRKAVAAAAAAGGTMASASTTGGRPSPSFPPAAAPSPPWMDWAGLLSLYRTTGVPAPLPATGDSVCRRTSGGEAVASGPAELAPSTVGDGRKSAGDEGGCGSWAAVVGAAAGGVRPSPSSAGGARGVAVSSGGGDGTAVCVGGGMVVSSKEMASK